MAFNCSPEFKGVIIQILYAIKIQFESLTSRGWSGGATVLGKLPVPGRPTI